MHRQGEGHAKTRAETAATGWSHLHWAMALWSLDPNDLEQAQAPPRRLDKLPPLLGTLWLLLLIFSPDPTCLIWFSAP